MHKLLDIQEEYARDLHLHYSQCVLYDSKRNEFMLVRDFEPRENDRVSIYYTDAKKQDQRRTYDLDEINEHVKAVSLDDGYVNLNGYTLLTERTIDGKYKKSTAMNNTSVQPLGTAYAYINKKRTKQRLDAYVCMKALKSKYYTFPEALKKLDTMFSVALSPSIALVKQPVKEGEEPVHVVYYDVYLGEVVDGRIKFVAPELEQLVIDQIKELGYEA